MQKQKSPALLWGSFIWFRHSELVSESVLVEMLNQVQHDGILLSNNTTKHRAPGMYYPAGIYPGGKAPQFLSR
jgi:hypothetical protein